LSNKSKRQLELKMFRAFGFSNDFFKKLESLRHSFLSNIGECCV